MHTALANVSNVAVWGSLVGALFLSAFLVIQAFFPSSRRGRYLLFAVVTSSIAMLDFFHSSLPILLYEQLRIIAWSLYSGALLWLFFSRMRTVCLVVLSLLSLGFGSWVMIHPDFGTTFVVPTAFSIAAILHISHFVSSRGFASCVLGGVSLVIALLCSLYYLFVTSGDSNVITLGYAHYAFTSLLAILFGWVHLPRELEGRAPVQIKLGVGIAFIVIMVVAELVLLASLLLFFRMPPYLYLGASTLQLFSVTTLFFYHRHKLVIHTGNIELLLAERTASLRSAQQELALKNEEQAEKLNQQKQELSEKALVIERQRRLELAAQTAGQVAHDIQNLVSPMLIYLRRLESVSSSQGHQLLRLIRNQADGLLELNSHMLSLSRRGRIERNPICVRELLVDVLERFPNQNVRFSGHGDPWVVGSWSQLSRAIGNLVTNGLDASERTGERKQLVQVSFSRLETKETRRCHLGFLRPGKYVVIEVADNGPGIASEVIEQIFEPFYSSKTSSERSGSGLGLSIVAAVADDHDAVLDLKSDNSGTQFVLYLPESESARQVLNVPSKESWFGDLLIVDDDPTILEQYGSMFKEVGMNVTTVEDGDIALRVLQHSRFDVMLLDINMPKRNGFETLFGAVHLCPGLAVIVHSGFVTNEDRIRLESLGVSGILNKPAHKRELMTLVRDTLSHQNHSIAV